MIGNSIYSGLSGGQWFSLKRFVLSQGEDLWGLTWWNLLKAPRECIVINLLIVQDCLVV